MNYELKQLKENKVITLFYDRKTNKDSYKSSYYNSISHYYNAKDYFEGKTNDFDRKEVNINSIPDLIGQGVAIFPISENWNIDLINRYKELGLKIAFCRAGVFVELKKQLKEVF